MAQSHLRHSDTPCIGHSKRIIKVLKADMDIVAWKGPMERCVGNTSSGTELSFWCST